MQEIVRSVSQDFDMPCPGSKDGQRFGKRVIHAAEG